MTKIVINKRIGGFGLSYFGLTEYAKHKGITLYFYYEGEDTKFYKASHELLRSGYNPIYCYTKDLGSKIDIEGITKESEYFYSPSDISRNDPSLIKIIEKFGSDKISSENSLLKVVEIPDDVDWDIGESEEGIEWIYEKHRTWS
jgi:hypothetical protein